MENLSYPADPIPDALAIREANMLNYKILIQNGLLRYDQTNKFEKLEKYNLILDTGNDCLCNYHG